MNRCVLLIALLAASVVAVAQMTPSNSPYTATQPQTIVLPGAGVPGGVAGPSTNTGTAVIIAPPSAPRLVTPEVHLTTVVPAVGATNATPGNAAGAANATAALPVPPRVLTTAPQYAGAEAAMVMTAPPEQTEAAVPGAATPIAGNAPEFNRGVGPGSAVAGVNTGGKSLAEMARENRQRESAANARLYTNEDIERMNQQSGVQVGGMAGAAVGAGQAAGARQPSSGAAPAVAQPAQNPPANPGVSRPATPATIPPDHGQASPPKPLGEMQGTAHGAKSNVIAPDSTTARPAPPPSQRQLPSGGSLLPLMAVLGLLAAGAGWLAR
jgi:hypothetical protein